MYHTPGSDVIPVNFPSRWNAQTGSADEKRRYHTLKNLLNSALKQLSPATRKAETVNARAHCDRSGEKPSADQPQSPIQPGIFG
jgi:hypothetical protein